MRTNDVIRHGIEDAARDLKVDEAGVIHQNKIGSVCLIDASCKGKARLPKIDLRQSADERSEKDRRAARRGMLRTGKRHDLLIGLFYNFDPHRRFLFMYFIK